MKYPPEIQERFEAAVAKYPHKQAALLTCLWIAQEVDGFVSTEAMEYIANLLEIPASHVYSVIGFYSMYQTEPIGKHHIQVCHTLSCALAGAEPLIEHMQKKLGIQAGETTPDRQFTLTRVECLASCGTGPMCQINREYHENLTPEKFDALIDSLKKEAP
ncbi:NADH-quinone oxidoreductase subunit NuoE [bacterium (Candidatus Blackallbacteria) CG17_big_fil_post_rev_8_21_14_2_50_48_46]|uniref:NADH-quinone oxidoreductase subunit NuoE n=1 Tax=bacterium (Candidatus Blackallbacteria) CG17_big_fil_post_rev_8_21_14_2_50_48_46 TaxID=2014261 RepID=A0A2M7G5W4_9BACT|nr:MAG: NADH-quinone oxidoreductase subunit NuoE [bacterium (Candidatus Blackallbacteria) CG18_big_fil_WC_8_21_14_2_50_49_26]PIW17355.1 MAG: NADH-quinone oxidoreductase subunit NuoE [bacterium (Candidatus Blackallbacteria) CG17_big_fil_post_rev_8_21_14_2_50_48_46]PIW47413.1 MAG: NADH-quinone oxidoreductase subunit NuoE [bacterium (Candidatus Blackallbacteria) CG13_big_fil_rev_8_21_14_2_50_49_14]